MQDQTSEEALHDTIAYGLKRHQYKPPRTHDASALDAYYRRVAFSVMEQLKLCGWRFERGQYDRHGHPMPVKE